MHIYEVEFDIANSATSEMSNEYPGAHVMVYLCAKSLKDAVSKAELEIRRANYEFQSIEQVEILDHDEWDDDVDGLPTWEVLIDAKEKNKPIFSDYFPYRDDNQCRENINLFGVNINISNTELAPMSEEFIGAYVVVYIPCKTIKEAMDKAEKLILRKNYNIRRMNWAKIIEIEKWDDSDEAFPTKADMWEAIKNKFAITSSYFCFSEDE